MRASTEITLYGAVVVVLSVSGKDAVVVHLDVFCWLQLFPATFFVPIAESVKVR